MATKKLLKNARIHCDGRVQEGDLLIEGDRIARIDTAISDATAEVQDVSGALLIPGVIDDQVHFREPGLTHKADLYTESRASLAGGITTFMEQPNTVPQTTTIEALEEKYAMASQKAWANFAFFLGGTNDNLEQLKRLGRNQCAGVKLFLGSSTGNMLVDSPEVIEQIFSSVDQLIATHCEDEGTIRRNLQAHMEQYGDDIPFELHPVIRSEEACYLSSSRAIELATKTGARLHVFHISTEKELSLFTNELPMDRKRITAEVCIHHLWFSDEDYAQKGSLIKWNPAVKRASDREALIRAVNDDRIDVIATDHAPHTREEKANPYTLAPSGGPMVQHALPAMLEYVDRGIFSMEKVVEKMCHGPARMFCLKDRGYLREGYFADMVVVGTGQPWTVSRENLLYKCGWSPMEGTTFGNRVLQTWVNGICAYDRGNFVQQSPARRVEFNRP